MIKLSEVLNSRNFLVTIVSIVVMVFGINNIDVGESPESIVNMFFDKKFGEIVAILVLNFLNPITKIIRSVVNKTFSLKGLLSSDNFITQAFTLVSMLLAVYVGDIKAGLIVNIVVQALNLIKHLKAPVKSEEVVVG